jgi:hypothetical protein
LFRACTYGPGLTSKQNRHSDPPKAESFVVIEGRIAVFLFDDADHIIER